MNIEHEKIENLINTDSNDYITDLINSIKEISLNFKKVNTVEHQYNKNVDPKYKRLHHHVEKKLGNLIKSLFSIIPKDISTLDMNNFDNISSAVEELLENVSTNIDIIKRIRPEKEDEEINNELKNMQYEKIRKRQISILNSISLREQYDEFDIDNSYYPFIPKLTEKFNAKIPLDERIPDAKRLRKENKDKLILQFKDSKNKKIQQPQFLNPYQYEIEEFTQQLMQNLNEAAEIYKKNTNNDRRNQKAIIFIEIDDEKDKHPIEEDYKEFYIQKYKSFNKTPLSFIDNKEDLDKAIEKLENSSEIAVDLEHHSIESYLGITCLLQISNRREDFIIDALKLRTDLPILNKIFSNPNILKVFHGANYDIEWLQKDFGIYVVNMFDTGQACRVLNKSSFALKFLLHTYCQYEADKKYQLEDWRKRPLSKEMINYARGDTHFLLYIYDKLKEELIEKGIEEKSKYDNPFNLYIEVMKKSSELCLISYQKPKVKSVQYYQFCNYNSSRSQREKGLIKEIYIFRDFLARKLNLNPDKVLSKKAIIKLAKLKEFTFDSIIQVLSNSSVLIMHINEFIKVVTDKVSRMEKKEKNNYKKEKEQYEKEYIQKVKELIAKDENEQKAKKIKEKFHKVKESKLEIENNKVLFDNISNKIIIPEICLIKNKSSKFSYEMEKDNMKIVNQRLLSKEEEIKKIKDSFSNFNLVNYLKVKHNVSRVEIKANLKKNPQSHLTKMKRVPEEPLNNIDLKLKEYNDIINNSAYYEELKNQKEDDSSSDSESEEKIKGKKITTPIIEQSLSKKEKFLKNFLQNTKNAKNYDKTPQYFKKRKKK